MRTADRTVDRERLRHRLGAIEELAESARERVVETVADAVGREVPLHDDGIDLEDRFSVPVVADVPYTSDTDRVRDELREGLQRVSLASTISE